ncbi:NYN domain-containing protein [Pseudogemmobacter humi]|uniref:Zc3h12a-like Ribonuclease NYN domain protein n=1 Tax=Pseudogemmobacter humi TaxID=2483812 RepID=A0A3P5X9X0_9RHOB|nr:hypothetical protein [Pseudogemmobacter humi]VDC28058.1 Zc3h12a-like Ribonuclease NYN domain protein [Pseudogemmobacter humi]
MTGLPAALMIALAVLALAALVFALWPRQRRPLAVLDGSNVMHWKDGKPRLETLAEVLRHVEARGYDAGIIFDANAGHLLAGRYMHDHHFRKALNLRGDRVMVVPKGQQADPFLLRYASANRAVIVSNDRFRDRIADHPDLAQPGRIIRGGWRDGALWLDLPQNAQGRR